MADKKISALNASTTPLGGTEVLPIVQGGSTVKVSVDNLTAGRSPAMSYANFNNGFQIKTSNVNRWIVEKDGAGQDLYIYRYNDAGNYAGNPVIISRSGGSVSFENNIVIRTAGNGIDFSANTHAAGMTSELLDWYEEGTWTGTLTAATPPTTPITKTGRYTRIGNQVTVAIEFDNVDTSGASGAMEVTGLPFTAAAAGYGPTMKNSMGTNVLTAGVYGGLSKVIFSDAGDMTTFNIVAVAGAYLRFSVTYFV